jgi:heme-degrading monooxygenase HmoA
MIARIWHGVTTAARADEYMQYLRETGIPDYEATAGNQGVYVLRRIAANEAHFLLLSLWQSADAIRAFAGPDLEKAKYYAEDKNYGRASKMMVSRESHLSMVLFGRKTPCRNGADRAGSS